MKIICLCPFWFMAEFCCSGLHGRMLVVTTLDRLLEGGTRLQTACLESNVWCSTMMAGRRASLLQVNTSKSVRHQSYKKFYKFVSCTAVFTRSSFQASLSVNVALALPLSIHVFLFLLFRYEWRDLQTPGWRVAERVSRLQTSEQQPNFKGWRQKGDSR